MRLSLTKKITQSVVGIALSSALLVSCGGGSSSGDAVADTVTGAEVVSNFRVIASAMLDDSLTTAESLKSAIEVFIAEPTEANLDIAKARYKEARVPYQQSEILRFDAAKGHVTNGLDADGGPTSVDDWEGQVNAWPLDEALIDYVDTTTYEGDYTAGSPNIINTTGTLMVGGDSVDVTTISADVLVSLNEIGGAEANVATGVHAVEFLLWGQDTNGTSAGAGNRPVSDYFTAAAQGVCTSGASNNTGYTICQRRADYLQAAVDLLVADLTEMAADWDDNASTTQGTLAYDLLNRDDGIARIVESMGDMAVGELASERMRVAVLFGSTEDEHDCFSDNTHVAIFNNAQGVVNAYRGSYTRTDGTTVSGASLSDLVKAQNETLDSQIQAQLDDIISRMQSISDSAEIDGIAFDQIVGGTTQQKALVLDAADALAGLGGSLEDSADALNITLGGIDTGTCSGSTEQSCIP